MHKYNGRKGTKKEHLEQKQSHLSSTFHEKNQIKPPKLLYKRKKPYICTLNKMRKSIN